MKFKENDCSILFPKELIYFLFLYIAFGPLYMIIQDPSAPYITQAERELLPRKPVNLQNLYQVLCNTAEAEIQDWTLKKDWLLSPT